MASPIKKIRGYIERNSARALFRNQIAIHMDRPIISFTFDDFPQSALFVGGEILKRSGLRGTYYTSLGLAGKDSPSGRIFEIDDLRRVRAEGHELGCHTFSHCHSWKTETSVFQDSICQNSLALDDVLPGAHFKAFSYPISDPRPLTKRAVGSHFSCCRAGGQRANIEKADLNQLSAFFLEKVNGDIGIVQREIDKNRRSKGWLIFATHDVADAPSPFGCTPEFFSDVVEFAVASGALILPVGEALERIRSANSTGF